MLINNLIARMGAGICLSIVNPSANFYQYEYFPHWLLNLSDKHIYRHFIASVKCVQNVNLF